MRCFAFLFMCTYTRKCTQVLVGRGFVVLLVVVVLAVVVMVSVAQGVRVRRPGFPGAGATVKAVILIKCRTVVTKISGFSQIAVVSACFALALRVRRVRGCTPGRCPIQRPKVHPKSNLASAPALVWRRRVRAVATFKASREDVSGETDFFHFKRRCRTAWAIRTQARRYLDTKTTMCQQNWQLSVSLPRFPRASQGVAERSRA